jgi:hypothetical protein
VDVNYEHPSLQDQVQVLILDSELESAPSAIQVDPEVSAQRRRSRSADDAEAQDEDSGSESSHRPIQTAGVDQGNAATEILDPFVRAIEVLVRGLAESLGEESGAPATVQFGSTVIQYATPGYGDDVVRVYRTRSDNPAGDHKPTGAAGIGRDSGERPRDRWELGASAAREGDHALALELFEQEAHEAEANELPQRAAIAYRSASRAAGLIGRRDYANKLLRLAGKHYLFVAEYPQTSMRAKVQAFVAAAKCFLQAGNLNLAASCIARATSSAEALGEQA